MQSKKIEKIVFITEDGKEFDDEAQAKKHEEITSLVKRIGLLTPSEIEQLFGMFNLKPKEAPQPVATEAQKVDVTLFKRSVAEIVLRNSRMQATPQAILGNLMMELQDLLR